MMGWSFCSVILNVLLVEVLHHGIYGAQQRFMCPKETIEIYKSTFAILPSEINVGSG